MDKVPPTMTPEYLAAVSQKTGLKVATVFDLLVKGWRYVEQIGEISRWEHPMWSLDRPNV